MEYRDDLEAAHQRMAVLDARVAELESGSEVARLRVRVEELEGRLRHLSAVPLGKSLLGPLMPLGFYLVSVLLVMRDADGAGWIVTHLALMAGLFGAGAWVWGTTRRFLPWMVGAVVKAVPLLVWAHGWWRVSYRDLDRAADSVFGHWDPGLYFFWCAPLLLTGLCLVEVLVAQVMGAARARG